MEYEELLVALESYRSGLRGPFGVEAVPMGEDHPARIALRRNGQIFAMIDTPWTRLASLAFSADGERLAAAGAPRGAAVWNSKTGALISQFADLAPWILSSGKECLPLRFAARSQFLLSGGRSLCVIETSGWTRTPIFDLPVVAILPDLRPQDVLIVGPDENGAYPVEQLALDSFTLSARGPIFQEHPTTTSFLPGAP